MTTLRRQHRGEFKAKVVLEALRGERTINEIATRLWGASLADHPLEEGGPRGGLPTLLSSRRRAKHKAEDALQAALYQQIGQLKVELGLAEKNYRCKTHS